MEENVDYCFLYPKDDPNIVNIKILNGIYKDVVYNYGKVGFEEKGDQVNLIFQYNVIESGNFKKKKLEKDPDFKQYIGDFLVETITNNLNQEFIDENRDNDL